MRILSIPESVNPPSAKRNMKLPLLTIMPVLMVLVMTVLDSTIINVALPVLAGVLGISDSSAVWLITVYQLMITMLLLPFSSAGEKYGFKRVFLCGTVIFTVASVACSLSSSFIWLMLARALQGIGAACVMGVNIALTRLIYPREILGRGMALNAMVIAVSTAAGPTIAGTVLTLGSWHWLFLINIPFGLAAFLMGKRNLPANPWKHTLERDKHFDWISAGGNMLFFGLTFLSLGMFSRAGDPLLAAAFLIPAILSGVWYIRRELKLPCPMLPVDLFRRRLFSLSILTSVASFIAQNAAMIALPFLYHNWYGFSEITTGLLMTPWSLATMIVSPLAARFVERHNPGTTAACGMGVYAIGIGLLLLLPAANATPFNIAWRMAVCGIGFGMFQTPNNIVMVMATPLSRSGGAGGMQGTARLVGQTLGATAVTLVFALTSSESSISATLIMALSFAIIAGVFSLSRKIEARA